MLFYDFEVFKYDWLTVIIDTDEKKEYVIVNDKDALLRLYQKNVSNIWVGFNNKHYDQYIFKGILIGLDPKMINDKIIIEGKDGWQISNQFNKVPMINFDTFSSKSVGLKTLEGFMGSNIKETDVDFRLDRKLTEEEIQETIKYCRHDVEQTIKVFLERINDFNSMYDLVNVFDLPLSCIADTGAQITARVLECQRTQYNDEFDFFFLPCLRIEKYKEVVDWFASQRYAPGEKPSNPYTYYKQSFTIDVAGVPHTFGFGGLHGAPDEPKHYKGAIFHVDANNYYPSMLIAWDLVTRSAQNNAFAEIYQTRKQLKYKQTHAATKEEAKMYKRKQLPYKQILVSLSGAMKDPKNNAFDPRNNNTMCINGQLMLLDLIEHLEAIKGFELIQSNTDGLIVMIPDTDEAFDQLDDICYEWESRCSTDKCSILLETDQIAELYQKDVNNYLWIDLDGGVERKGAYVKEQSSLDYDLPIINHALVEYMTKHIPIEQTIRECNDLIMFQKIVKLTNKYDYVMHECGMPRAVTSGKRKLKTEYVYEQCEQYTYKCYRVFASNDLKDGRLLKVKKGKNGEKFANTPEHAFVCNDDVTEMKVPQKLDKNWYIDLAINRLHQFGI